MINILIIDDQKLVLESLKTLLKSEPQLKIVGTAINGEQGIATIAQLKPDVLKLMIRHLMCPVVNYFKLVVGYCYTQSRS